MGDERETDTQESGTLAESESIDAILHLLAHSRRRDLLTCLQQHDDPLPLADVADELAVGEHGTDLELIPAEEVKRIYMTLYHTHIPKLVSHGVVQYNQSP